MSTAVKSIGLQLYAKYVNRYDVPVQVQEKYSLIMNSQPGFW